MGKYIPREGLHTARQSIENNLIKVILGPRRAGGFFHTTASGD
ncbi:MAG: hypothetical protein NT092_15405 [Bacteroidia bacterium]|nr:hypothetical protein [Bacteroidia bacterium]